MLPNGIQQGNEREKSKNKREGDAGSSKNQYYCKPIRICAPQGVGQHLGVSVAVKKTHGPKLCKLANYSRLMLFASRVPLWLKSPRNSFAATTLIHTHTHTHTRKTWPVECGFVCVWVNLCIVTQIERADWPQETLYQASASHCSQTTWRIRHVAAKGAAGNKR